MFAAQNIVYSPSTFIVDRDPHKFGGDQKEYLRRSQEAIAGAAARIKTAVAEGQDLTQIFFVILEEFCKKRAEIARDAEKNRKTPVLFLHRQDPDKVDQYGRRRDTKGGSDFQTTILDESYDAYGKKLLATFRTKLFEMETQKLSKHKWSDECGAVKSSLEIEILENTELQKRKWLRRLSADEFPAYFPVQLMDREIAAIN